MVDLQLLLRYLRLVLNAIYSALKQFKGHTQSIASSKLSDHISQAKSLILCPLGLPLSFHVQNYRFSFLLLEYVMTVLQHYKCKCLKTLKAALQIFEVNP